MKKQNKSSSQKRAVVWMIVISLILMAAAVGIWYWRKLPSVRVMRGIARLAEEVKEYENPVLQEAGLEEILKQLQYGAAHVEADVELETPGIRISIPGINLESRIGLKGRIELEGSMDQQSQLLGSSLKLHMADKEVIDMAVAADAGNLYLTLPALFQDTLRLGTTDFGAKFNDSIWHELTGWTLPEDYQLVIFREDMQETMAEAANVFEPELYEQLFSKTGMLARSITITSAGKIMEIERDGKQEACKGYFVSIEPETADRMLMAVREMLRSRTGGKLPEAADFPAGSLTGEVKLEVYLDAKDRIVHLNTAEPLRFSNPAAVMELTVGLTGTVRTADKVECRINMVQDAKEGELIISWNAEPGESSCKKQLEVESTLAQEKKFYMESEWDYASAGFNIAAAYSGADSSYDIRLQGALETVTTGEAVRIALDSAEIQKDDKEPVALSGSFLVEPLSEEIMIPEESVDLFSLSVLDMIKLLMHFQIEKSAGL